MYYVHYTFKFQVKGEKDVYFYWKNIQIAKLPDLNDQILLFGSNNSYPYAFSVEEIDYLERSRLIFINLRINRYESKEMIFYISHKLDLKVDLADESNFVNLN